LYNNQPKGEFQGGRIATTDRRKTDSRSVGVNRYLKKEKNGKKARDSCLV